MSIPAALQAHYDSGSTSLAYGLLLQRTDGELFGMTSCSKRLVMDITPWGALPWNLAGETAFEFDEKQGLDISQIVSTAGFEVDNAEITTLDDGSLFSRDDILAGRWNGTLWRVFRYRWDVETPTIADDVEVLHQGKVGEFRLTETTITVELRSLKQGMQQPVGIVSQPTCRVRFGSMGLGMCNVDPGPYTHIFTVTAVTDKRTFTASSAIQGDDHFGAGVLKWLDGENAGLSAQVSTFSGGVFTFVLPMVFDIQVGDEFSVVAGCRKRRDEDCLNRYANVVNFQGEPDRPTRDFVVSGTT